MKPTVSEKRAQTRKLGIAAGEPGQQIIQLRQFDLQLPLAAAGMTGKNIEDELSAIDYAPSHFPLEIALLHGSELTVEDNQRRLARFSLCPDLIELSVSHHACGINGLAHLQNTARHNGP